MSELLRATSLEGHPVVTLSGESPLEVRDVVFDHTTGDVLGFTLRKKGFFGGPVSDYLPWGSVHGLGPDAVMVRDESALSDGADVDVPGGGDVIGDRILTESGTDLGEVVEVVVSTGPRADVAGFEVAPAESPGRSGDQHVYIPMPDTLAISGEKIIVPDAAADYVCDDLTGFGGAVDDFRARLSGERS